jgi:serine/threonine-protein kinase HipA
MVFNTIFANYDDHLKNHSFIYDHRNDSWALGPAYDITYPFNLDLTYLKKTRALSLNGKRRDIELNDMLTIAETFAIRNPKGIIREVQLAAAEWEALTDELAIPEFAAEAISKEFRLFVL